MTWITCKGDGACLTECSEKGCKIPTRGPAGPAHYHRARYTYCYRECVPVECPHCRDYCPAFMFMSDKGMCLSCGLTKFMKLK